MKPKRSRTGCRTCRSRKVKCDETPNGCGNCNRLGLLCTRDDASVAPADPQLSDLVFQENSARFQPNSPEQIKHQVNTGLHRNRTYRSCRPCRSSKVRCSGDHPRCKRCIYRDTECLYDTDTTPQWVTKAEQRRRTQIRPSHANGSPVVGDARLSGHKTSDPRSGHITPPTGPRNTQIEANRRGQQASLSWLFSPSLPEIHRLLQLMEEYFANIHPLRSFGFIHKPSFVQRIEDLCGTDRNNNVLLLVVCALGAKFFAGKHADQKQLDKGLALHAGGRWSRKAHSLLFAELNKTSVEALMATVLLHELELRVGNYASAFMLTGLSVRMAQGLQINLESPPNMSGSVSEISSPSFHESRRRLMWSVYVMDAWVGSGMDELTLLQEAEIHLQLPCNERDFVLETPRVEEHLDMMIANGPSLTLDQIFHIDLSAQFIRLVSVRKKVLRYVKHLDESQSPWVPGSEFSLLQASLDQWHEALPASLLFNRSAVYMRRESNQQGALLLLHLAYHQSICDLTRIGMRELFKIRVPVIFPPEKQEFLHSVQDACFDSCMAVAGVFAEALRNGTESLADTWLCVVAHDSIRVLVHYATNDVGSPTRRHGDGFQAQVASALRTNIQALQRMVPMFALARPLYAAALRMASRADFNLPDGADPGASMGVLDPTRNSRAGTPPTFTPEYVLNPLAIYRLARKDINDCEQSAQESGTSSTSPHDEMQTPVIQPSNPSQAREPLPSTVPPLGTMGIALPESFQLPTSFDDLQSYLYLPSVLGSCNGDIFGDTSAAAILFDMNNTTPGFLQPSSTTLGVTDSSSVATNSFEAGSDNLWGHE